MIRISAVAALAAALLVAPAAAQDPTPGTHAQQVQRVSHRDLDLGDARGLARLDRRLLRAARSLCGTASTYDLAGRRKDRRCAEAALARTAPARTAAVAAAAQVMVADR